MTVTSEVVLLGVLEEGAIPPDTLCWWENRVSQPWLVEAGLSPWTHFLVLVSCGWAGWVQGGVWEPKQPCLSAVGEQDPSAFLFPLQAQRQTGFACPHV